VQGLLYILTVQNFPDSQIAYSVKAKGACMREYHSVIVYKSALCAVQNHNNFNPKTPETVG
jgi:hypothetical protein